MLCISEKVIKLINDYRDACWAVAKRKANVQIAVDARMKLEEYISRYKQALEGLTPGGSEFVDDPERCAKFVRDARDSNHRQINKLLMEKMNVQS